MNGRRSKKNQQKNGGKGQGNRPNEIASDSITWKLMKEEYKIFVSNEGAKI
jgi:hypothetical protein